VVEGGGNAVDEQNWQDGVLLSSRCECGITWGIGKRE